MRSTKVKLAVCWAFALVALSLFASAETKAMSKVCLFSPVKGKVLRDGKPVADAVVVRTWNWSSNNKKGSDETKTDLAGEFSFPAVYETMLVGSVLPHEPIISLTLTIRVEGKEYEAFKCNKNNYTEGAEFGGDLIINPLELDCDLAAEPVKHKVVSTPFPKYYYGMAVLRRK